MSKRFSRRNFLRMSAACGCGMALQPSSLGGIVAHAQGVGTGPVMNLHFIYQSGGWDTGFPFQRTDAQFLQIRPTLALPNTILPLNSDPTMGLHPNLTNLQQMLNTGEAALLRNVDLTGKNDRGHDTAGAKMVAGSISSSASGCGFLSRAVNQAVFNQNGLALLGLGGRDDMLACTQNGQNYGDLATGSGTVADSTAGGGANDTAHRAIVSNIVRSSTPEESLSSTERLLNSALLGRDMTLQNLRDALTNIPAGTYTVGGYGNTFRDMARLSKIPGIPNQITWGSRGGFDTHSGQAGIAGAYAELNTALAEFKADVGPAIWDRTLLVFFAEFGRTAAENGSMGTDHGEGQDLLIVGGALARGGILDSGLSGQPYLNLNRNSFSPIWHNHANIMAALLLGLTPGLDIQAVFPGINPAEVPQYSSLFFG